MTTRQLRADAARNRDAIVVAAAEVFAAHGIDAPLDEIAKHAGTANATLYRRFPTRADLVDAVFADRMAEQVRIVDAALELSDPWAGFAQFIREVCASQARDRGIAELVTMDLVATPEVAALRDQAFHGVVELISRAKDAGELRADVTAEDVVVVLMANAGLVRSAHAVGAQASARLAHLLLDGYRARAATDGPAPPGPRQMKAAMRAQSHDLRLTPSAGGPLLRSRQSKDA